MKKGDIIEGEITDYSFPNKGSFIYSSPSAAGDGSADERKIIVKNALPGSVVKVRIIKKKTGYAEGTVIDVVKKSPLETKRPICNHFYSCGGCTYQTVSYTNQLKLKEDMVKKVLKDHFPAEWEGIIASPDQFRYRNKMEFTFGDEEKDGPLTLGLHRQFSNHDILSIDSCGIVSPTWNEILKYTQKFYRKLGVPFYNKYTHMGVLRNLVIRQSASDGKILVNLVTTTHHSIDETTRNIPWNEKRSETVDELHLPEYVAGLLSLGEKKPMGLDAYSSHGYQKANTGKKIVRDKWGKLQRVNGSFEDNVGSGEFDALSY